MIRFPTEWLLESLVGIGGSLILAIASSAQPLPAAGSGGFDGVGSATVAPPGLRHLYVWDSSIPGYVTATSALLSFCLARGVDVLFLEASPVGYNNPGAVANYTAFVDAVHGVGIAVMGLCGYEWFAFAPGSGGPPSWNKGCEGYGKPARDAAPSCGWCSRGSGCRSAPSSGG